MDKNNYVIYYKNIQWCLDLGMKFKKIHGILKFKQKNWMKPYIDFNTQKKKQSMTLIKTFFKLLNNGKIMKNLRKRIKIKIVKTEKDIVKHTSKPSHVSHKILIKIYLQFMKRKYV